jgi:hypothetical protein
MLYGGARILTLRHKLHAATSRIEFSYDSFAATTRRVPASFVMQSRRKNAPDPPLRSGDGVAALVAWLSLCSGNINQILFVSDGRLILPERSINCEEWHAWPAFYAMKSTFCHRLSGNAEFAGKKITGKPLPSSQVLH